MPSKQKCKQQKFAKATSLKVFKKKRLETSLTPNLVQFKIDDRKLSTTNTTITGNMDNTNNKFKTQFWNESANKTDLDIKEKRNGNYEKNLEKDKSKIEKTASSKICKMKIKSNRGREEKLCRRYKKGSKKTQMRKQKSIQELEKEISKTYDIQVLWQQSKNLKINLLLNNQAGLEQLIELPSINFVSFICPISKIPYRDLFSLSKQ